MACLPLPCSGRQVYLLVETHGLKQTEALLPDYLSRLHAKAALRDVALEEDQVYSHAARDFVEWKPDSVPEQPCLRANIHDLLRQPGCRVLLALYGSVHAWKKPSKIQADSLGKYFYPLAYRLEQEGVRTFSLTCLALSGRTRRHGMEIELPPLAAGISLATGETLGQILTAVPGAAYFYVDTARQGVSMPGSDPAGLAVDAFLFVAQATPMESRCVK